MAHLLGLTALRGLVRSLLAFVLFGAVACSAVAQQQLLEVPTPADGVAATLADAWIFTFGGGKLTQDAICGYLVTRYSDPGSSAVYTVVTTKVDATTIDCTLLNHGVRSNDFFPDYAGTIGVCSSDSVLQTAADGGVYCKCTAGVSGGKCAEPIPHTCPKAGTTSHHPESERSYLPGSDTSTAVCNGGCAETFNNVAVPADGSSSFGYGDATYTGQACGANAAGGGAGPSDKPGVPPSPAAPADPVTGPAAGCSGATMCSGTVNGTVVCVACGSKSTNSPGATSSTAPDGTETAGTTSTNVRDNLDGTTTTTTTTTSSTGAKSTTITTAPGGSGAAGGGGAGAGGGTCVGSDCGDGTDAFGGSCGAAFTCSGDAIQCAIAQEQHVRACQMYDPATAGGEWASGAQKLATAKTDGDLPAWSPAASGSAGVTNFQWSGTIDQSSTLTAQCPADVIVGSTGLVLSFSTLCGNAATLGSFFVAITSVMCAFILFKGTK